MRTWKGLVLLVLALLLIAPVEAYKGSQLSRGPIESFQLIDQNGDAYSFDFDSEGVIVASFIFTRCPDVCPVITQSLKSVEQELTERERQDVTFVSITVDPEYDISERLAVYADLYGVDWPYLIGTVEEFEFVWATFGLVV
jgi:protein SCO1/2